MTVSRGSRPTIVSIGHLHPRRVSRRLRRDVMSRPVHPDLRDVWLTFPVTLRLFRCKLCVLQPTLVAEIHRAISKCTPKELRDNINQTTLSEFFAAGRIPRSEAQASACAAGLVTKVFGALPGPFFERNSLACRLLGKSLRQQTGENGQYRRGLSHQ